MEYFSGKIRPVGPGKCLLMGKETYSKLKVCEKVNGLMTNSLSGINIHKKICVGTCTYS